MKNIVLPLAVLAALLSFSIASGEEVRPLRQGETAGPENPVGSVDWQHMEGGRVPRTFDHQPPVIPHSIAGFIITATENYCLGCHNIENSSAPKPFKTHYMDREGTVTPTIAKRWWFCTQCHVGQADRAPVVESHFEHKVPTSPYEIKDFVIDADHNQCLLCHGMEGSKANKPPKTHYQDQDGNVTDKIGKFFWNCSQCHEGKGNRKPPMAESVVGGDGGQKK